MATSQNFPPPQLPTNPKAADWEYFRRTFNNFLSIIDAKDVQKLPTYFLELPGAGWIVNFRRATGAQRFFF